MSVQVTPETCTECKRLKEVYYSVIVDVSEQLMSILQGSDTELQRDRLWTLRSKAEIRRLELANHRETHQPEIRRR